MQILMISSYLPYPLLSGGQIRLYNLIKELSQHHQITLICEKRQNQSYHDIAEMEKICHKVITVDRYKQWSLKNIFKATTSRNSFLLTGHTHPEMQQKIRHELTQAKFDLIHVETYYVMQNIPPTHMPIILAEHNIEYQVYKRYMDKAPAALRPLLALDIAKMKKEEQQYWKKANQLVAVSHEDQKTMHHADRTATIVPNGVNPHEFKLKNINNAIKEQEKRVLFIGDFKWIQNQDSAKWIIQEIWPAVNRELKTMNKKLNVKLWIVARQIPESIKNLTTDSDVIFDEQSSSLPTPAIFQIASALLAPIRVGGGTSYKILESMACGTPVITMHMSARAIEARDNHEILVGRTPSELAEKVIKILTDSKLYAKIADNGRLHIEEHYTWKTIAKKLDEVYKEIVELNPKH